jgi:glycosyltransferase involved in cell wall biosynthesis
MTAWLLVAGDFTTHGGMDSANFALASYLARHPHGSAPLPEVHLVSHRVSPELTSLPAVRTHIVPRPLGAERLGEPLLRRSAERWQKRLGGDGVTVVANGGNIDAGDVNWVHYVHAAFVPEAAGAWNQLRVQSNHRRYVLQEHEALHRASVVICNSNRTADDVVKAGVSRDRTRVVYYGVDAARFGRIDPDERAAARRALNLPESTPLALFVGALADRRKGFDTVFEAWRSLCLRRDWDVALVIVGTGAELPSWKARAAAQIPGGRMRFLGFRSDMPAVFAACDVLLHPARYEAYGLAVHEAVCRGLPALVSATAGVAERYPQDLSHLLIADPKSPGELSERLLAWRSDSQVAGRVSTFASRLRDRSWEQMARDIVSIVQGRTAWARS